jgi:hypothetical protein
MVHNTQNYWVFFGTFSIVRYSKKNYKTQRFRNWIWHNLKQGLKLAQQEYEKGDKDEARILEIESHGRYSKYKDSAHKACLTNTISQLSLDFSPFYNNLISNEVTNSHRRSL